MAEITKKIQTLRTQFGQEVGKIEKSQSLNEEFLYKPKIWWFPHLEWIGNFMKTRTDSTPLSAKVKNEPALRNKRVNEVFVDDADETANLEETQFEFEYETEDPVKVVEHPPLVKKQRTYLSPKVVRSQKDETSENIQTIQYTLINEDSNEVIQPSQNQASSNYVEFDHQSNPSHHVKCKRRSKAFGRYIAALMTEITDDRIFFELQKNITNAVHDANMKQLESGKS